jgi:hypothetical protein
MLKNINQNFIFQKILPSCFYGSFIAILLVTTIELIFYPGVLQNRINISLSSITMGLGGICLLSYMVLNLSKYLFKHHELLITVSIFIILVTIGLFFIESINYPNFVFSRLHINKEALYTLSLFLFTFLLLSIARAALLQIFKKNPIIIFKKIFKSSTKQPLNIQQFFSTVSKIKFSELFSKLLLIVILCITPILSYFSWNQHLSNNNITKPETKISIPKNIFLFLAVDETKSDSLKNQFFWFFKPSESYGQIKIFFSQITISFSTLFTIIALLFYINWLLSKRSPRVGVTLLVYYVGGIVYSFLIIFICVRMFSIGELSVFMGRYILTYVLALFMFSFYLFLDQISKEEFNVFSALYLAMVFFVINVPNIVKLKPVDQLSIINRKKIESISRELKNNFSSNDKPIFHTIGGEGPIGYRYYLAPYSVITPIWQEWDVFMLKNPSFKTATHVYLSSASEVTKKWSNQEIKYIFKDIKYIKDNGLYKVVYSTKDMSLFQLELINP